MHRKDMKINESIGFLLNSSARLMKRKLEKNLKKYNVTTSQWAVMQLLYQRKILTQAEIAEELNSDRATCGAVLDKLNSKGFVTKQVDEKDRRAYRVSLTDQGMDLVSKLADLAQQCNEVALISFTKEDWEKLQEYLNQIITNLMEEA